MPQSTDIQVSIDYLYELRKGLEEAQELMKKMRLNHDILIGNHGIAMRCIEDEIIKAFDSGFYNAQSIDESTSRNVILTGKEYYSSLNLDFKNLL